MGDLTLKGATSGQITLTPTAVAGTNTLTLPAKTGNVITSADSGTVSQTMLASGVVGNGPAFGAYSPGNQSISNGTWTKISVSTEEFDTANCFDSSTNYRFTPNVAGYYQVSAQVNFSNLGSSGEFIVSIYKNGSEFKRGFRYPNVGSGNQNRGTGVGCLLYLNGSTDYIELYTYQSSGSSATTEQINVVANYFEAAMVRSA